LGFQVGDSVSFSNLAGNTLTLDTLHVKNLFASNTHTGQDVLPDIYYFGTVAVPTPGGWHTGVAGGTGFGNVILPGPVYYGSNVSDPLNPFISANAYNGIISTDGSGNWPLGASSLAIYSNIVPYVNVTPISSGRQAGLIVGNYVDGLQLFLPSTNHPADVSGGSLVGGLPSQGRVKVGAGPVTPSLPRVCWYIGGAPPQSPASPWGNISILSRVKTDISGVGSYTTFTCSLDGSPSGGVDVNGFLNALPVNTTGSQWATPYGVQPMSGGSTSFPTSPDMVDVSGAGYFNWASVPTSNPLPANTHPGFWVQSVILNKPVSTSQYQRTNYSNFLFSSNPITTGQGVRFSVWRSGDSAANTSGTFNRMTVVIGNKIGTLDLTAQSSVGTGSRLPYLQLLFGCASSGFTTSSIRWSSNQIGAVLNSWTGNPTSSPPPGANLPTGADDAGTHNCELQWFLQGT
jgi:hypothetical protein